MAYSATGVALTQHVKTGRGGEAAAHVLAELIAIK